MQPPRDAPADTSDSAGRRSSRKRRDNGTSEDVLRQRLALLEEALETISDGFVLYDADDRVAAFNHRHKTLFPSIAGHIAVGASYESLLETQVRLGHFDSAKGREEQWKAARLKQHRNPSTPVEQVFEDGRIIRLSEHLTPSGGVVGIRTDITEIRRAEQALRQRHALLLESIAQAVFGTDMSGCCTFANAACVRLFGAGTEAELAQRDMQRMMVPDDAAQPVLSAAFAGLAEIDSDAWCTRLDGTKVPVSVSAHPVFEQGRQIGVVVTCTDVTNKLREASEREQLEAQLRQAHKMEAVGQLAGGIAHDFNNVLAIVLGFADLALANESKPDQTQHYLQEIRRAGRRAQETVAQLLSFSREQGRDKRLTASHATVREALSLLKPALPASIELEVQTRSEQWGASVEPVQLHQLVVNLCINARDAMPGAGTIFVSLDETTAYDHICASCGAPVHGEFAALTVRDDGPGIASASLARIFDPFFTTKPQGKGTGMGLSVVHGIVHECGGHILVQTATGHGTAFTLLLPRTAAPAQAPTAADESDVLSELPTANAGQRPIWVVDDEAQVCRLLEVLLGRAGYQVTVFESALTALDALRSGDSPVDLLISDQTMPGAAGTDLAKVAHEVRPDLPVFICTGYADRAAALESEPAVARVFAKPLDLSALRKAVDEALSG